MDKKNSSILRKLAYLPMFLMMVMIFWFSAETGEQSSEKSDGVAGYVWDIADYLHLDVSDDIIDKWNNTVTFVIRKVAHMTEYAILAVLIFLGIRIDTGERPKWYWVIGIGVLYAASDEIHQLLVPGRSGQFRDVCIDGIGVVIGFFIMKVICKDRRIIPGE